MTHLRRSDSDGRTVCAADPASLEIYWARFYDPITNEPVFAGSRDGYLYKSFAEMVKNNPTAHDFFTQKPLDLITKSQAKWRKKLAAEASKSGR